MKEHEIISLIEKLKIYPEKIRNQLLFNQSKRYPEIKSYYNVQEYSHVHEHFKYHWIDDIFARHEGFKLYNLLSKCPLDIQAQILSAMKPTDLICFSMTNRYWYDFCQSDRMQVYWQGQITFKINSKPLNYYRLYRSYKFSNVIIRQLLDEILQFHSRTEKIQIVEEIFQLLINYPEMVTYHYNFGTIVKKKLIELYHQSKWPTASEFYQRLFNESMPSLDESTLPSNGNA